MSTQQVQQAYAFNRTILELKQVSKLREVLVELTFNRTILELKHFFVILALLFVPLLIVPYWN